MPFDKRGVYDKDMLDLDVWVRSQAELISSVTTLESGDVVTVFGVSNRVQNRVSVTETSASQVGSNCGRDAYPGPRDRCRQLERSRFAERGTLYRMLPDLRYEVRGFNVAEGLRGVEGQNVELRKKIAS